MIKVAREGAILLEVESEAELRRRLERGEVLTTDHRWSPGESTWRCIGEPESPETSEVPAGPTLRDELAAMQRKAATIDPCHCCSPSSAATNTCTTSSSQNKPINPLGCE